MTANSNDGGLVRAELGAMRLLVPSGDPKALAGTHGQLWQWVGDGRTLIALTVTIRQDTQMTTPMRIHNHLTWELDQLAEQMTDVHDRVEPPFGPDGAPEGTWAVGSLAGTRKRLAAEARVLVTTDGEDLYIVQIVVTETPEGRALAGEVLSSVEL